VTGSNPPDEFRYRDDDTFAVGSLFAVAAVLFLSSLVTGLWGVAALAHASWLESGDLPGAGPTTWGIGMLVLATIQGITALLVFAGSRVGAYLGIAIAVVSIIVHLSVISAFPVGSAVSIALNLVIVAVLFAYGRRR
jgi:hypothetical protein